MGQVLHGSATTTEVVRRAIQHSKESLRALATRHGVNQKTVAKWRKRSPTTDLRTGPKDARSTTLTIEDEAVVVAFRRHTLLPLDDCLYALQVTIPHLTRSLLHRCLQRHGISRLPDVDSDKPVRKKFKAYPIGYFTRIWLRCGPSKASCTYWWRSTGRPSSLSLSCTRKPHAGSLPTSFGTWSRPCRIGFTRCSPIMVRTSPIRPAMAGRLRTSRKCAQISCRSSAIPSISLHRSRYQTPPHQTPPPVDERSG